MMMTARGTTFAATVLVLLFACGAPAPGVGQSPKGFEFSYEEGHGNSYAEMVRRGRYDGYDSEKQARSVDTEGGQTTYKTQLSDDERNAIYEAVMQNGLLAIKTDFMNLGGMMVEPSSVGRLQIKIDGKVTGIPFSPNYGRIVEQYPGRFPLPPGAREDWTRLRKVLDVINGFLTLKDDTQVLRRHNGYL